jgi:DNA topoisomerase VI subunit B
MNTFEFAFSRVAASLAAVATSAITIGALVVLPAQLEAGHAIAVTPATARSADAGQVEVTIDPGRIDVVASARRNAHPAGGRATTVAHALRATRYDPHAPDGSARRSAASSPRR